MEAVNNDPSSAPLSVESEPENIEMASDDLRKELEMAFNVLKGVDAQQLKFLPTACVLGRINEIVLGAWEDPNHGNNLGPVSCGFLRSHGVIDFILKNIDIEVIQSSSAKLLKSSLLTEENREYVASNGLKQAVSLAASVAQKCLQCCRAASGILEYLSDHSERVCLEIFDLGGFDTILYACRKSDETVLQHCSCAIANLSIFGNPAIYALMMTKRVPLWLFPLSFYHDNVVKYYALIAMSVLYNNGFGRAEDREYFMIFIEQFVVAHSPCELVRSDGRFSAGRKGIWLKRIIPLLTSEEAEIRVLSSFHFCMEASIKNAQRQKYLFNDIGAIQPLKTLASKQEPIASRFAHQALLLLGETDELPPPDSNQLAEL